LVNAVIREIKRETDVKETIEEVVSFADQLDGVILLYLYKDGSQGMRTSTLSGHQKSFLFAFFQAWMVKWFRLGDE
jgi:hypothetical protein